jgi:hypothetical protein
MFVGLYPGGPGAVRRWPPKEQVDRTTPLNALIPGKSLLNSRVPGVLPTYDARGALLLAAFPVKAE